MKCFKKIIPFFFVFAILVTCLIVPGSAAESDSRKYTAVPFWDVAVRDDWGGGGFWGTAEDYKQFVDDLGFTQIDSDGYLYLVPRLIGVDLKIDSLHAYYGEKFAGSTDTIEGYTVTFSDSLPLTVSVQALSTSVKSGSKFYMTIYYSCSCPIDGKYSYYFNSGSSFEWITTDNNLRSSVVDPNYKYASTQTLSKGQSIGGQESHSYSGSTGVYRGRITAGVPYYRVEPLATFDFPGESSRVGSITGDYGIIGDNGSIIKVDGNMIVDESSSTVYNPVTNTTLNYTDYAYDYSDRSYNLTLEDGSTMKVTYGDENVTINEGDTVYNIYYIVPEADQEDDGSGSGGSGDTHSHDYTSEITKLPNCLLSGVRTFTCSCGDSYTKTVPATGHDWQISQQIANTFDPETGEPLTTGYTIYTCATCGEQYKSTDGNGPPNGSTGDDEDGGGLISGLLGAVGDVIGGLIEGVLLLATKALEALTGLGDLFAQMIETVLGFFGGFIDFLSAMFPFLPEETITILNLGLILMIAAAVFNRFFK